MKIKSLVNGAFRTLFVILTFIIAFASTASAHKFNRGKIEANCSEESAHAQGYRIMLGSKTHYSGAQCWNGTSQGGVIHCNIEPNIEYVCMQVTNSKGQRLWKPVYKRPCGNQIDIDEEEVELDQQQSRREVDLSWVARTFENCTDYGWQLFTQGQNYGFGSVQYAQCCQYVHDCQPTQYTNIQKTVNNYYVDNSINNSFNTKNPFYCPPVKNQKGLGDVVDVGRTGDPTPVGDNGSNGSTYAARTNNNGTSLTGGNNPTGATGRNGSGVLDASLASNNATTNNGATTARAAYKQNAKLNTGVEATTNGATGRNKPAASMEVASNQATAAEKRQAKRQNREKATSVLDTPDISVTPSETGTGRVKKGEKVAKSTALPNAKEQVGVRNNASSGGRGRNKVADNNSAGNRGPTKLPKASTLASDNGGQRSNARNSSGLPNIQKTFGTNGGNRSNAASTNRTRATSGQSQSRGNRSMSGGSSFGRNNAVSNGNGGSNRKSAGTGGGRNGGGGKKGR